MDRRKYGWAVKILICALLYTMALIFCGQVQADMGLTHIRLDREVSGMEAAEIARREIAEDDPTAFCFWGEEPAQTVNCRETGRSAQAAPVLLAGNPGLMGAGCLAWQKGCLVDEETARKLFQTTACGGQRLWYKGEEYPVLGTVDALRPTMLLMAEEGDSLDRLALAALPEKGAMAGEEFLYRWGLQGEILDFFPFWALIRNLLLLLPGAVLFRLSAFLGRKRRPLGILCALGCLWLLGQDLVIPAGSLPTRWSDFSFWGKLWEGEKKNALEILFTPMGNSQLQMCLNMVKSGVTAIAAGLTALWPVRRERYADTADRGR